MVGVVVVDVGDAATDVTDDVESVGAIVVVTVAEDDVAIEVFVDLDFPPLPLPFDVDVVFLVHSAKFRCYCTRRTKIYNKIFI